jgi:hypothetical protein
MKIVKSVLNLVLFDNLDALSYKSLIKGLIMFGLCQENRNKVLARQALQMKENYYNDMKIKNEIIDSLENKVIRFKNTLRNLLEDVEN